MIGQTLGHYRIVEKLGEGGTGVVYKAEDTRLSRFVALKLLPEEFSHDRQAVERFRREARAASTLHHPNICTIYEIGEHEGRHFLAMELLEGQTLEQHIGGRPLSSDTFLALANQIADALNAAHTDEIVHGDLKPTNIFVTKHGQAKILNFGLANLAKAQKLIPGAALGSVAYQAPEQVRGEKVGAHSDIFSFGTILYEMATGCQAFSGSSREEIADAILHRDSTPHAKVAPDLPPGIEGIINRALQKDSKLRYPNAGALRTYLIGLKLSPDSGRAAVPPASSPPSRRRPKGEEAMKDAMSDEAIVSPLNALVSGLVAGTVVYLLSVVGFYGAGGVEGVGVEVGEGEGQPVWLWSVQIGMNVFAPAVAAGVTTMKLGSSIFRALWLVPPAWFCGFLTRWLLVAMALGGTWKSPIFLDSISSFAGIFAGAFLGLMFAKRES